MSLVDTEKEAIASSEDSLISRWSRRKQAVREEALSIQTAVEIEIADPPAVTESHELCDADMPSLDSLGEESDYRGFLSPKVSESLRRQALHILFHGPSFNIRDGLDDYDEEYTSFAKLGDIVTSDMRHQLEVDARRLLELVETEKQAQTPALIQTQGQDSEPDASPLASIEAEGPPLQANDPEIEL